VRVPDLRTLRIAQAARAIQLVELIHIAVSQKLALRDPFFALDAALEAQVLINPVHFVLAPVGNLVEVEETKPMQGFLQLRTDAGDDLQVVGLAATSRCQPLGPAWLAGGYRLCRRHGSSRLGGCRLGCSRFAGACALGAAVAAVAVAAVAAAAAAAAGTAAFSGFTAEQFSEQAAQNAADQKGQQHPQQ
jgi:hypothetical protein